MSYYKLGEAVKEVSNVYGAGDTTVAGLKLLGKTLFNVGHVVVDVGVVVGKGLLEKAHEEQRRQDGVARQAEKSQVDDAVDRINQETYDLKKKLFNKQLSNSEVLDIRAKIANLEDEKSDLKK